LDPGDADVATAVSHATAGRGVAVAFDAVGIEATRRDCLLSLSPGGRLVLAGLHTDESSLPLNVAIRSELSIAGAFAYSPVHFSQGLTWLAEERVGLRDGVVVDALSNGQQWYERLVAGDAASKVLLQPQPDHMHTESEGSVR
ncbi:MAG: zinc-binding dehydrogenase, partial [Ilumatobacteraceae bacterium]